MRACVFVYLVCIWGICKYIHTRGTHRHTYEHNGAAFMHLSPKHKRSVFVMHQAIIASGLWRYEKMILGTHMEWVERWLHEWMHFMHQREFVCMCSACFNCTILSDVQMMCGYSIAPKYNHHATYYIRILVVRRRICDTFILKPIFSSQNLPDAAAGVVVIVVQSPGWINTNNVNRHFCQILGCIYTGIVAYNFDTYHAAYYGTRTSELFFYLMAVTFLVCTGILLISCLISWSTGGIISKTIFVSIGIFAIIFSLGISVPLPLIWFAFIPPINSTYIHVSIGRVFVWTGQFMTWESNERSSHHSSGGAYFEWGEKKS